jgi:hypothetical protein
LNDGLIAHPRKKNIVKKQPTQKPRKNVEIQDLKIGTWKVRSLYRTRTLITVVSELDRYGLAILAIQETRWPRFDNHKTEKATLFYNRGLGHERGVGFVVSDRILNNIK